MGVTDSNLSPVTLSLSDENFGKLVSGKTKAQSLFMSGKLKIKGNVMKGESNTSTLMCFTCIDILSPNSHQDGTYPSKGQNSIKAIDLLFNYITSKYQRIASHLALQLYPHSDDHATMCCPCLAAAVFFSLLPSPTILVVIP